MPSLKKPVSTKDVEQNQNSKSKKDDPSFQDSKVETTSDGAKKKDKLLSSRVASRVNSAASLAVLNSNERSSKRGSTYETAKSEIFLNWFPSLPFQTGAIADVLVSTVKLSSLPFVPTSVSLAFGGHQSPAFALTASHNAGLTECNFTHSFDISWSSLALQSALSVLVCGMPDADTMEFDLALAAIKDLASLSPGFVLEAHLSHEIPSKSFKRAEVCIKVSLKPPEISPDAPPPKEKEVKKGQKKLSSKRELPTSGSSAEAKFGGDPKVAETPPPGPTFLPFLGLRCGSAPLAEFLRVVDSYDGAFKDLNSGFSLSGPSMLDVYQRTQDEEVYYGQASGGKRHGRGIVRSRDGSIWLGTFDRDERRGVGTLYTPSGDMVIGAWDGNTGPRKARLEFRSGATYTGHIKGTSRHGFGSCLFENKDKFHGRWFQDSPNGAGAIHYADGSTYEGDFVGGQRHGYGTLRLASGDVYMGEWANGIKQGLGRYTYANGDCYQGSWFSDRRNGMGTMRFSNGDVFSGSWVDDLREGDGRMSFTNGDIFTGEWCKDCRAGQGALTTSAGRVVSGKWANNQLVEVSEDVDNEGSYTGEIDPISILRHGLGKLRLSSQDPSLFLEYNGPWQNGLPHGPNATALYLDGSHYTGEWQDGFRDGQGTSHQPPDSIPRPRRSDSHSNPSTPTPRRSDTKPMYGAPSFQRKPFLTSPGACPPQRPSPPPNGHPTSPDASVGTPHHHPQPTLPSTSPSPSGPSTSRALNLDNPAFLSSPSGPNSHWLGPAPKTVGDGSPVGPTPDSDSDSDPDDHTMPPSPPQHHHNEAGRPRSAAGWLGSAWTRPSSTFLFSGSLSSSRTTAKPVPTSEGRRPHSASCIDTPGTRREIRRNEQPPSVGLPSLHRPTRASQACSRPKAFNRPHPPLSEETTPWDSFRPWTCPYSPPRRRRHDEDPLSPSTALLKPHEWMAQTIAQRPRSAPEASPGSSRGGATSAGHSPTSDLPWSASPEVPWSSRGRETGGVAVPMFDVGWPTLPIEASLKTSVPVPVGEVLASPRWGGPTNPLDSENGTVLSSTNAPRVPNLEQYDVYEGQWSMDVRHGYGVAKYANGDVFWGQWKFGHPCGQGRLLYHTGGLLVGEFCPIEADIQSAEEATIRQADSQRMYKASLEREALLRRAGSATDWARCDLRPPVPDPEPSPEPSVTIPEASGEPSGGVDVALPALLGSFGPSQSGYTQAVKPEQFLNLVVEEARATNDPSIVKDKVEVEGSAAPDSGSGQGISRKSSKLSVRSETSTKNKKKSTKSK